MLLPQFHNVLLCKPGMSVQQGLTKLPGPALAAPEPSSIVDDDEAGERFAYDSDADFEWSVRHGFSRNMNRPVVLEAGKMLIKNEWREP